MFKAHTLGLFTALLLIPLAAGCGDKKDSKSSDAASKADDKDDKKSKKDDKAAKKDDKEPAKKGEPEPAKKPRAPLDTAKYGTQITNVKYELAGLAKRAEQAFEREDVGGLLAEPGAVVEPVVHALCKSATPVPETVPSGGEKYQPRTDPDVDFNAGDKKTGWPCLKFEDNAPIYFQYSYTEGSTPKLAARGEDVAKGEAGFFEICAEADFEPGGKTTLICQTGQVKGDRVVLSTDVVELGEGE